jgi:hypothetical protein
MSEWREFDALLGQMNDMTRITSAPNARRYADHYVAPSGELRRPVITVHTSGDTLAMARSARPRRAKRNPETHASRSRRTNGSCARGGPKRPP